MAVILLGTSLQERQPPHFRLQMKSGHHFYLIQLSSDTLLQHAIMSV